MAYDIGQIRSPSISNFYDTINLNTLEWNYTIVDDETEAVDPLKFKDPYLPFNSGNLLIQGEHYYLRFDVKKTTTTQNISLKLKNPSNDIEDIEEEIQNLKTYNIQSTTQSNNIETHELIFTPNKNYSQILWELKRSVQHDYNFENQSIDDNSIGRKIEISNIVLYKIKNILLDLSLFDKFYKIIKIGIQGPSALLICINGQQIRIGKSKIFEINEEISIDFLGFVPKANEYFIIDYEFSTDED